MECNARHGLGFLSGTISGLLHKVFHGPGLHDNLTVPHTHSFECPIPSCEYLLPGHTSAGDAYREVLTQGSHPTERQDWPEVASETVPYAVRPRLWLTAG